MDFNFTPEQFAELYEVARCARERDPGDAYGQGVYETLRALGGGSVHRVTIRLRTPPCSQATPHAAHPWRSPTLVGVEPHWCPGVEAAGPDTPPRPVLNPNSDVPDSQR